MDADFEVLGIPPGSSKQDIRQAYRKQCLKCHPDKRGTAEKFIKLTEAYKRLINVTTDTEDGSSNDSNSNTRDESFAVMMVDFLQTYIIEMFNAFKTQKPPSKTPPIYIPIKVTISEVYHEVIKKATVRVRRKHGNDYVYHKEDLYIQLSKATSKHVFVEKGDDAEGHVRGDVVMNVQIQCESGISVDNFNIVHELGVSLYEYIYGLSHTIQHMSGEDISIQTIPLKTQEGALSRIVLPGKGFPHWIDDKLHYGDMIIHMYPILDPDVFSKEEVKQFMKKLFE